ncbi:MAG: ABC transporter permease subunit [Deltaproteobacteria bacterium]|jgi:putative spermidine/putrescine transport system permease protein|nr:ABC transporter permease subunit [Deltaproteobacteria bacterium]
MKKGFFFYFQFAISSLTCLFLIAPVFYTVGLALTKNAFLGFKSGLTLEWISKVLSLYGDTIVRGLLIALGTLLICSLAGIPAAYALVKSGKSRFISGLEEALVLPLTVPGLSIGLGILLTWGGLDWFRKSSFFIMAGHGVFCLPFMVRSVAAVMRTIPLSLYEEAAATLGAGFFRRFFQIVTPAAAPGILAGALQVLALSLGEFNITWMLQTPFTRTLPVGLADSYASMRLEIGSAYTLIFLVLIVPLLVLAQKLPSLMAKVLGTKR